jgi:hypothetical protein
MWQGAEQEFAAGSRPIKLFQALGRKGVYVFKPNDSIPRALLQNGGLCYIHSNLFEVCTPECRTPREVVAYDKACEAYARLASWAYEEETGQLVHLYKTSIAFDPKGQLKYTTVGTHENYLVKRENYKENSKHLVPYLILRQVFTGSGSLVDGRFLISPRTIFPRKVYSEKSSDYPIFSTRDEPHTHDKFCRAHIVNGEGARSEYTTFLKHSITGFVLKALEKGYLKQVPKLNDPISTNKEISLDLQGDWSVSTSNGKIGAVDYLNSYYLDAIERLFQHGSPDRHEEMALREFKWVLGKLDEGLFEDLNTSIEWIIKKNLIEVSLDTLSLEEGLSIEDAKEASVFQYTAVTDPLFDELVETQGLKTIVTESEIENAFLEAPLESRGSLRVILAREFKKFIKTISWSYIKLMPNFFFYPFEFNDLDGWNQEAIDKKVEEIYSKLEMEY